MRHGKLYLFTPHSELLYARLGWKTFERSDLAPENNSS